MEAEILADKKNTALPLHKGPMSGMMHREQPQNTMQTLRRLTNYIGKNRLLLFTIFALVTITVAIDIAGPFLQQKAIDTITLHNGELHVDFPQMKIYLLWLVIIYIVDMILMYIVNLFTARLSQSTVYTIRSDLFNKVVKLPIKYMDTHKHGDLMSRMTSDVENVSNAIAQSMGILFASLLTLIGAFFMMFYYSYTLALIAIITIPITIVISKKLSAFMQKYFKRQQQLLGSLNSHVEEMVTGYHTVAAYGKEAQALTDFAKTADSLRHTSIWARVCGAVMGPIMNFLGNFQYVLLASVGGYLMLNGTPITIGSIQAMLQYSKKFSQPINMIANQYSLILTALAGAERIFAVMDNADEVDNGTMSLNVDKLTGTIEFTHMYFSYEKNKTVLKDLSLSVKAGQKIALVGATGSGKTTIVNLLTRFYELDSGAIHIDHTDITTVPKQQLRSSIAIVLQDTVLFHDTIAANIRYGNLNATDEQVRHAAKIAMADNFIERLPKKYETILAENGSNLSQGQRQLLSIARAVLADPKILILDEATSSVDTRTEMQIQQAMINLMHNRTSLIIAHRLSTIVDADKIIVIDNGTIAEMGSHEELLQKRGAYFNLYNKQFAGIAT